MFLFNINLKMLTSKHLFTILVFATVASSKADGVENVGVPQEESPVLSVETTEKLASLPTDLSKCLRFDMQ